MNSLWLAAAATLVAATAAAVFIRRSRQEQVRLLESLTQMLDSAIDGSFSEKTFDESRLSALEAKMSRYLNQCDTSSRQLAAEKERIQALIADISHQTKTPMANILLYAQLMEEQALPPESRLCLEALSEQAQKLHFLINALVKMGRLETGIIATRKQRQPVQDLIDQCVKQIRPKANDKDVSIIAPETADELAYDAKWTVEALYNVLDNAVKYAPAGSTVTVTAQEYPLFYRLDVADAGPGIAEDEQSKIFRRFYRSPAVAASEGVGIGLYLTREILAQQGGYIKVASRLGEGSVFSLFLPR